MVKKAQEIVSETEAPVLWSKDFEFYPAYARD